MSPDRAASAACLEADAAAGPRSGESRWILAAVLIVFTALNIALRIWLPGEAVNVLA